MLTTVTALLFLVVSFATLTLLVIFILTRRGA